MAVKSVAVLGAGHGGFAAAADLGSRGYSVRLQARNAERLAPSARAAAASRRAASLQGLVPIALTTTDVAEAVTRRRPDHAGGAVGRARALCARARAAARRQPADLPQSRATPAAGCISCTSCARPAIAGRCKTCETVSLTYVTRMEGPATVGIYSYTKQLGFAALPGKHTDELFDADQAALSGDPQGRRA